MVLENIDKKNIIKGYKLKADAYCQNNDLTNVILPDYIEDIGEGAFYDCENLQKVSFGSRTKRIDNSAFQHCHNLSGTLMLPNTIEFIGNFAFQQCESLDGLILGNNLSEISQYCFSDCRGLSGKLVIPNKLKIIENGAFSNCVSLSEVVIGKQVTHIERAAFFNCQSLQGTLVIPSNVVHIKSEAFCGCLNIKDVVFECKKENDLCLEKDIFKNCKLSSITIHGKQFTNKDEFNEYLEDNRIALYTKIWN